MTVDPREFEALEEDTGAFDIRVDGVPVWERIRFGVYRSILEQNGVGQAHSTNEGSPRDYLKGLTNWLKNWVHRNPFLADPADVMFVGHQRRKKLEDDLWWDIYCDPIHEACGLDSVHFEYPYLLDHLQPAKTEGLRYLELISHGGMLQRKLGLHRVSIPESPLKRLEAIEREVSARFRASIDIQNRVRDSLRRRRSTLWLYERLLKRISPKVVVLVVSYGKETFIEACHNEDVTVVELQHGVIDKQALGYHFPGKRNKETFPDYFLTWGEYWNGCVEFPIKDERVIPVGYAFLEQERNKYDLAEQQEQVLFISQGTVGKELSEFAVEVGYSDIDFDIVYKLHPGEYDRWRQEYPWLVDSHVTVVDNSKRLYQLFVESKVQVGAYSTAVYEGLAFGLDTYLLDVPRADEDGYLRKNGYVTMVNSPEEFIEHLGRDGEYHSTDMNPIFRSEATENICTVLEHLLHET